MKRLVLACVVVAGCSRTKSASSDPAARMFETPYQTFITQAGAQTAGCVVRVTAKGDAGTKTDSLETTVRVDDAGDFVVKRDDGVETVRVGSITWQRESEGAKLERVESGARSELQRDASVVAWRALLAPFRERITLTKTGAKKLGSRDVDVFDLAVEQGGGDDGGPAIQSGKGTVEIDVATGFPVAFAFEGEWEATAPDAARGRVKYSVGDLKCAVAELGSVDDIAAPEPVGPPDVAPVPSPSPVPSATKAKKSK